MKVCFYGLGSIGKRHLLNLATVCSKKGLKLDVHAVRSGDALLPNNIAALISRQFRTSAELDDDYDAAIIANPTSLHFEALRLTVEKARCFFIEKPVFDSTGYDIERLQFRSDSKCYVAAPLRYNKVVRYMAEITKEQKIYAARAICSTYLPDWRPGQDYRTVYSAQKALGGGVRIDLIHEWDYLSSMFGFPTKISSLSGTFSHLEIDSEDIAIYIAKYSDKLVELHLDYFGRRSQRYLELYTKNGTITGDIINSRVQFSDGRPDVLLPEETNSKYMDEMEYFVDLVTGKERAVTNSIAHAIRVIKLANGEIE